MYQIKEMISNKPIDQKVIAIRISTVFRLVQVGLFIYLEEDLSYLYLYVICQKFGCLYKHTRFISTFINIAFSACQHTSFQVDFLLFNFFLKFFFIWTSSLIQLLIKVLKLILVKYCNGLFKRWKRFKEFLQRKWWPIETLYFNPLQPSVAFLYPLKTPENLNEGFLMFSGGVEKQHRAVTG